MNILVHIWRRATKMTQGLSIIHETAETVQPGEEMSQEDLVNVYTYLMGGSKEYRVRIFTVLPSQRTRGSKHKLKYKNFFLNTRKNIFTVTVVNTRASHPEGLCTTLGGTQKTTWAGQQGWQAPLVPSFPPLLSYDSRFAFMFSKTVLLFICIMELLLHRCYLSIFFQFIFLLIVIIGSNAWKGA